MEYILMWSINSECSNTSKYRQDIVVRNVNGCSVNREKSKRSGTIVFLYSHFLREAFLSNRRKLIGKSSRSFRRAQKQQLKN